MTGYVELHAHSYYSLLDGVPSPEELVQRAAEYEMPALALTDHDALYGAPRFDQAARAPASSRSSARRSRWSMAAVISPCWPKPIRAMPTYAA